MSNEVPNAQLEGVSKNESLEVSFSRQQSQLAAKSSKDGAHENACCGADTAIRTEHE